ncbi:MAG: hypothetical protein L6V78_03645 [Clostridium sp.]|nr:MAG: hypothetical protein L6V78_03645 [Clostridium sp.]
MTVLGLQYKISSVTDEEHPDRGTGTIQFIDSFSKLGSKIEGDIPKMAIFVWKYTYFYLMEHII